MSFTVLYGKLLKTCGEQWMDGISNRTYWKCYFIGSMHKNYFFFYIMKDEAKKLIEFLDGSDKRFVIPVYQRNYDWRIENCKQLFDDLINLIKSKQKNEII